MSTPIADGQLAEQIFRQARRRALLNAILGLLRRRSTSLLPLAEVRARVQVRSQRDLGLQTIPLSQIVGSEGRADDFDRHFSPRTLRTRDRWKSIVVAYYEGRALPPIDVYKLGDIYFVRDGNHRVSVARENGQAEIEAYVVELKTDVALRPEITTRDLVYVEEQNDFLEWTNLAQVRQSIPIEVSVLGGYLDLIRHINQHKAKLRAERQTTVGRDEAIADWYDNVYLPVATLLRQYQVRRSLAGMTEADIFLAILQHQSALHAQGVKLSTMQAAEHFVAEYSKPRRLRRLFAFRHLLQR